MNKHTVAHVLEQIAALLELRGAPTGRPRSFHDAARSVSALQEPMDEALASGALAATRGIAPEPLDVIAELVGTGQSTLATRLRQEIPGELAEMLHISGLGVAKIRMIHEQLGVTTIAELEAAARDGRLATLPRFGDKTAENVLKGIQFLRSPGRERLFHHALKEAEALREELITFDGIDRVEIAGALRRRCETIQTIDFVISCRGPRAGIAERLGDIPGVVDSVAEDDAIIHLRFTSGSVARIHLTEPEGFGTAFVRATGAAAHLEQLGWVPEVTDEATLYVACGLQYIPPELREGLGEIELARRDRVPHLVEREDLRGFLHCHTTYSDGTTTIEEWARACQRADYDWVGITDHSHAAPYAGGLTPDDIARQHDEVDAVNALSIGCQVLKGIEVDILRDGTLDFDDDVLVHFDFVIASIHSAMDLPEPEMTARLLTAMDNRFVTIIGHPTGRLLLSRDPYPLNIDAIFAKAADVGVAIEVNADPQRLDLDWRLVREAIQGGVTISVGADAHSAASLSNADIGLGILRKGMATRSAVLNTRTASAFLEYAQRRHSA